MKQDLTDFFNEPAEAVQTTITQKPVPNLFPRITNTQYKIAVIGEAPGVDEVDQAKPFVGYSGQELDRLLSRFSILRDACFLGNVSQYRPEKNQITNFEWEGVEIQSGLTQLKSDLSKVKPNICLLLGATALHAFKSNEPLKKRKTKEGYKFVYPNPISRWRGSFFTSIPSSPLPGVKCIASYHPAACLRNYEWTPVLMFDIKRCLEEATFPELIPPQRTLKYNLSLEETLYELQQIIDKKPLVATDIEGRIGSMSCISFATSSSYAFIVPFSKIDGSSYWSLDEEVIIWRYLAKVLCDPRIPKVLQNGAYDRFVLQYGYQLVVKGVTEGTDLKHWEIYSELKKSLAFMASIYTREPYWKEMRIQSEQLEETVEE